MTVFKVGDRVEYFPGRTDHAKSYVGQLATVLEVDDSMRMLVEFDSGVQACFNEENFKKVNSYRAVTVREEERTVRVPVYEVKLKFTEDEFAIFKNAMSFGATDFTFRTAEERAVCRQVFTLLSKDTSQEGN